MEEAPLRQHWQRRKDALGASVACQWVAIKTAGLVTSNKKYDNDDAADAGCSHFLFIFLFFFFSLFSSCLTQFYFVLNFITTSFFFFFVAVVVEFVYFWLCRLVLRQRILFN